MKFLFNILIFFSITNYSYSSEKFKSNPQFESIIEDFLLKNPEVIIKSLENFRNEQESKLEESINLTINNYYKKEIYNNFPFTGNKAGEIIITEFIDYNCGYCKKTLKTINKLVKSNKDLKVIFIDFPILSETSYSASKAALAAYKQNAYFEYHSSLLNENKKINEQYLYQLAEKLNLDLVKFKKDFNSDSTINTIEANIKFARKLNIRGTPSFIIDKKIHPGAYDYNKLQDIIKNSSF